MKNIHILPTDKPSRLWTNNLRRRLELDEFPEQHPTNIAKHIYITSNEEIKDYDWYINSEGKLLQFTGINVLGDKFKAPKVILTTDPQLIADGVQAIDDKFLEWFCSKNGKVNFVEVIAIEDEKN